MPNGTDRGHHPEHTGLQKHSVGGLYPLAVVGIGNGERVMYVVENLNTGTTAGSVMPSDRPRQWDCADLATAFAEKCREGGHLPHPYGPVVWRTGRCRWVGNSEVRLVNEATQRITDKSDVFSAVCGEESRRLGRPLTQRELFYIAQDVLNNPPH